MVVRQSITIPLVPRNHYTWTYTNVFVVTDKKSEWNVNCHCLNPILLDSFNLFYGLLYTRAHIWTQKAEQ